MDNQKELFNEILDKICDENNSEAIALMSENGVEILFEQIAVIPQDNELYLILKPVQPLEGVGEDEGLVFFVNEEEYRYELVVDEERIDKVFEVYDSLVMGENDDE